MEDEEYRPGIELFVGSLPDGGRGGRETLTRLKADLGPPT